MLIKKRKDTPEIEQDESKEEGSENENGVKKSDIEIQNQAYIYSIYGTIENLLSKNRGKQRAKIYMKQKIKGIADKEAEEYINSIKRKRGHGDE